MNILGIILLFAALGLFIFVYKVEKERDRLKYILPLITAFGIMGFALIFRENIIEFPIPGVDTIKTVAQQTLDDAKLVKEVRETVLAQSKTIGLVVQQANEMRPEMSRIAEDVKKFDLFLEDMTDSIQKEYQKLLAIVTPIRIQNDLPILADKSISQGDREAFKEIMRIAQEETEMSSLKKAAMEEITKVVGNLSNSFRTEPPLTVTLDDGTVKKGNEIPSAWLIMSLSDSDWKMRAGAAKLLGSRTEKEVPDALLQTIRTDTHLVVAFYSLASFRYVINPRPRLAGEELLPLSEAVHMLSTDKLDQWWKAHSAEVNERLADMK